MKYLGIILIFTVTVQSVFGQVVADFENFLIPVDTFLNGKNANGGFESGDVILSNDYNPQFDAWTGFAISSETNKLTGGFNNQYASIAGSGAGGSQNYAVAYAFDPIIIHLAGTEKGRTLKSCSITNNTFAYYSMLNGDQFSKKFGGANGDEPDFFKITVRAFLGGQLTTDSLEIYLADYRSQEDSFDYILDEWTDFDLSSLGLADSLQIALSSSDVGGFGMNTPAYFCIDNIITEELKTSIDAIVNQEFNLYPNPSSQMLYVQGDYDAGVNIEVFNAEGRMVFADIDTQQLNIGRLEAGRYFVRLKTANAVHVLPFLKVTE
jgi:hypothetical protein